MEGQLEPILYFFTAEERETIRITAREPTRGIIYDRNGKALATNATVPEIGVVPGQLGDDKDGVIKKLANMLDMEKEDIEKQLSASWVTGRFIRSPEKSEAWQHRASQKSDLSPRGFEAGYAVKILSLR